MMHETFYATVRCRRLELQTKRNALSDSLRILADKESDYAVAHKRAIKMLNEMISIADKYLEMTE